MGPRWIAAIALAMALPVAGLSEAALPDHPNTQTVRPKRPNILIVVTDDQRADALGYMPTTKKLFREGGRTFRSAFSTTPMCCPARASIMTGRYVHNHGVLLNDDAAKLDHSTTLQFYLKTAGYRSALSGKFLNSWPIDKAPPSFDRWAVYYPKGRYTRQYTEDGIHSYKNALYNNNGILDLVQGYATDYIGKRARHFLRAFESDDRDPWMLYVAPFAPHMPATPARRHRGDPIRRWGGNPATRESDRTDKPVWVQEKHQPRHRALATRRKQVRSLKAVDDLVERLFDELKTLGEARDTLAFFVSDNGYLWGEHRVGAKQYPYLPSVQIPLMVRWPGMIPPGTQVDRLVANIDILPTVLEAAGVTPSSAQPPDGRSLLSGSGRDRLLLEFFKDDDDTLPDWAATLTRDRQYIEYYAEAKSDVVIAREYYDLDRDPWQLVNLLGDADPTNDPLPTELLDFQRQLREDRQCAGEGCP